MTLTLEQKIGQLLFVGIPGKTVDDETRRMFETVQPGGVVLFARNIESGGQVAELTSQLRSMSQIALLVSIDQEGGRVDRLKNMFFPTPSAEMQRVAMDAAMSYRQGELTAEILRLLGLNMNFAPVLDVRYHPDADNGLQDRYFGSNAAKVIRLAGAYLEGLQNNGIVGCGKHFPGLGDVSVDAHAELPVVKRTRDQLWAEDIAPYRDLFSKLNARLNVVMISHAHYEAFDTTRIPGSLSHNVVTKLLRDEMEFKGLTITDDMEMGAILNSMDFGEACVMAVEAGEDMLAVCQKTERIYQAHEALVRAMRNGRFSERRISRSLNHIASIKSIASSPQHYSEMALSRLSEKMNDLTTLLKTDEAHRRIPSQG
ncbi:MAG TPA: beta-N-acetylhexosaminidase [Blastocatellia bacterium]|nr:beta-N-acetylhexosaminidase [Blastocatellia bacterium]